MSTRTRVRPNDPDTSWFAAMSLNPGRVQELQHEIVFLLRRADMTYDELARALPKWSPSGVRTRTKELRELGWVTELRDDEGVVVKRRAEGGQPSIVWRSCDDGERTGVDRRAVDREPADPAVDRFDIAAMRAAIEDVRHIYSQAAHAHAEGRTTWEQQWQQVAARMDARLDTLRGAVLVEPVRDTVTDGLAFAANDRADRLF